MENRRPLVAKPERLCKGMLDMKTTTAVISIQGLITEAIPALRQAFEGIEGVQSVDFSLERSVAVVEFDGKRAKVDDLLRAVLKAGYQVL